MLRVGACVAVILLHLSATMVSNQALIGTVHWHVSNVINALTRWCVPIFIMVSGALLLDPRRHAQAGEFWARRLGRLLPALLVWSAIYIAWRAYIWEEPISLGSIGHDVIVGLPFYHLYFIFLIAGLYLVTPFLRKTIATLDRAEIRRLMLIVGVLSMGSTLFAFAYGTVGTSIFTLFVPYLFYFIAGWYCLHRPSSDVLTYSVALGLATATTIVMTDFLAEIYGIEGRWSFYLYEHFSPTVMIAAVAVFLLALHIPLSPRFEQVAQRLAPLTFGVYLAHPLVIELLRLAYKFTVPSLLSPPYYIPVTFILTAVLTASLVSCLQRIPGLRRTV